MQPPALTQRWRPLFRPDLRARCQDRDPPRRDRAGRQVLAAREESPSVLRQPHEAGLSGNKNTPGKGAPGLPIGSAGDRVLLARHFFRALDLADFQVVNISYHQFGFFEHFDTAPAVRVREAAAIEFEDFQVGLGDFLEGELVLSAWYPGDDTLWPALGGQSNWGPMAGEIWERGAGLSYPS